MANTHTTLSSLFTAIANAIRTKTGNTDTIVADDFPDAIAGIQTGFGGANYKAYGYSYKPSGSVVTEGIITNDTATAAGSSLRYAYIDLSTVGEGIYILVMSGNLMGSYFYPTNKSFAGLIEATTLFDGTQYGNSSRYTDLSIFAAKVIKNGSTFDIYDFVSGDYLYSGTRLNFGGQHTSGGSSYVSHYAVQIV